MNLPIQSRPVTRGVSIAAKAKNGVAPSDLKCTLCHLACNALPEPARSLCNAACDRIAC